MPQFAQNPDEKPAGTLPALGIVRGMWRMGHSVFRSIHVPLAAPGPRDRKRGKEKGGPSGRLSLFGWIVCLLDDDLDAAVLRLADTVRGLDQQARFATADHGDGGGRHAFTHQGILDRVRTTQ